MASTLQNFGVPMGSNGGAGSTGRSAMLMPKVKNKFRVRLIGFGPVNGGLEISQQVVSVGRPAFSHEPVAVHSYNSIAYYASKASFNTVELVVRDDVTNSVSALVGYQEQKQMNHFEQTTSLSGSNYKFDMYVEALSGGNDAPLEQWYYENCFASEINYDSYEYSSSEPMLITMTIRADNATLLGGLFPDNPVFQSGSTL